MDALRVHDVFIFITSGASSGSVLQSVTNASVLTPVPKEDPVVLASLSPPTAHGRYTRGGLSQYRAGQDSATLLASPVYVNGPRRGLRPKALILRASAHAS